MSPTWRGSRRKSGRTCAETALVLSWGGRRDTCDDSDRDHPM